MTDDHCTGMNNAKVHPTNPSRVTGMLQAVR
jgi:hypothetical protein